MSLSIFSYKPPHDGTLAYLKDGKLVFSIEGEKDSHPRTSGFNSFYHALKLLDQFDVQPDVVAWGGGSPNRDPKDLYQGTSEEIILAEKMKCFGRDILFFRSSHERAHLFCSYGLSPFPQGQPVYALVWEGGIGRFYEIDGGMRVHAFETVLKNPGMRYALPYSLANPQVSKDRPEWLNINAPGKTMALAAYGEIMDKEKRKDWSSEIETLLKVGMVDENWNPEGQPAIKYNDALLQATLKSPLRDIGVESEPFKDFSYRLSQAIFDLFYRFAQKNLNKGYPLLISGGCGLNCDWNTQWRESGLFQDVFVPPCTNDSGIALGMAVDAQRHVTGGAKIDWSVYCGEEFVEDPADLSGFQISEFDFDEAAAHLEKGKVLAWVEGKYEMGPRALCHRSLIAAPFQREMTDRLNKIKNRESFRPIAPVCLEEEVSEYFEWKGPSPYMLHFQRVKSPRLQAVTHVNNTARVQTVNDRTNPRMAKLLRAFKKRTGFGVLCNTSLNYSKKGFINRMSDLVNYARKTGLDGFAVGDKLYLRLTYDVRRAHPAKQIPPRRPFLDLNLPVVFFPLPNPIQPDISPQGIVLRFDAKSDFCVMSCPSNVGPFAIPHVVDVLGYRLFRFQALVPKDLRFFLTLTESGANHPDSGSFQGVKGADGECYAFPKMTGTGDWAPYQVDLTTLTPWRYWGNQNGNKILDLQGLRSVEFFVSGQAKGEIRLRDLEFTVERA